MHALATLPRQRSHIVITNRLQLVLAPAVSKKYVGWFVAERGQYQWALYVLAPNKAYVPLYILDARARQVARTALSETKYVRA
ncbi:MAG: hypothetical protein E6R03_07700 [Hyphomicrobiaceae bacterium]|nr:MAG: hypothetical protein E6R03_07700 [Hyphomicrobiaceae bacterium]